MSHAGTIDTLSEALLRDFHVGDAAVALIDAGDAPLRVPRSQSPMLHLVLDGTVAIECGGHPVERISAGEAVLLFYGDPHRIMPEKTRAAGEVVLPALPTSGVGRIDAARGRTRATLLSYRVQLSYVAPAAAAIRAGPAVWTIRHDAAGPAGALGFDVRKIAEACSGPGARAFCLAVANLLVVQGMRAMYRAQWNDVAVEIRSPATRRAAAAVQAIQAHPERPWTVASLAQIVGISRSSFASAFRETLGMAPLAYIREIRLERARRLLESGGLSVAEVARRSGYALPSSFARAFAQRYGSPPSGGHKLQAAPISRDNRM